MVFLEKMRHISWPLLPIDKEAKKETSRERNSKIIYPCDDEEHLKETTAWICRGQDSSSDGGVSRSYKASKYRGHGIRGWQPSYPETTGYIIPTMFELNNVLNESHCRQRALRMADWEIEIQMESGAVMGSVVTTNPTPAVFNTGQVIFGWIEGWRRTETSRYLEAAKRAGDYLVSVQEMDGSWVKGNSDYALRNATTYNTRVAWALIELGLSLKEDKYIQSGKKNVEYALLNQQENGWFRNNCLNDPEKPLLHTIGYATRGILESGICLNETRYIDAAIRTLNALLRCQRPDGGFPGRFSADWSSKEQWDCLTGDVQVAISWLRVHSLTGEKKYKESARRAIDFVKKTQNLIHSNPGIRGGVKGSYPFDGPYGQFELLNWAAKFLCDALLMINYSEIAAKGIKG
jgi:hypothetical protein